MLFVGFLVDFTDLRSSHLKLIARQSDRRWWRENRQGHTDRCAVRLARHQRLIEITTIIQNSMLQTCDDVPVGQHSTSSRLVFVRA